MLTMFSPQISQNDSLYRGQNYTYPELHYGLYAKKEAAIMG